MYAREAEVNTSSLFPPSFTSTLQAPIASGARVVFGDAGVAARPLDIFTNYSKIGRVTRPVAIMHGSADQVVPISNGEALFDALKSPHEVGGRTTRRSCHFRKPSEHSPTTNSPVPRPLHSLYG